MRTTSFQLDQNGAVQPAVEEGPTFAAFETFDGQLLERVHRHEIAARGDIELHHIRIAVGGRFVRHSSSQSAFCHIVEGDDKLDPPNARALSCRGPETYVFLPDTLHNRHDVTVYPELAVAILPGAEVR